MLREKYKVIGPTSSKRGAKEKGDLLGPATSSRKPFRPDGVGKMRDSSWIAIGLPSLYSGEPLGSENGPQGRALFAFPDRETEAQKREAHAQGLSWAG